MEHLYAAFIKGFFLALGFILPLGAQKYSFILNQSSLERKYWHALPIILTAALLDTALIMLAVLGVSLILMQFAWLRMGLLIFGAIFMSYIGWTSWKAVYTLNTSPKRNSIGH